MVEMRMPFSLCLPVSEVISPSYAPAKMKNAMGDPGKAEKFELPRYAYIFILKKNGEDWNVFETFEETLSSNDWVKQRYYGIFKTEGDSIFRYTKNIRLLLNANGEIGRVYAIASNKKLTFNVANLKSLTTLEEVLDLKINTAPDSIQQNLQNIYSSPYNYNNPSTDEYYGSFDNIGSKVATLNLLLYHIAAKVDIKWNVEDSVRIDRVTPANGVRLTYMDAIHLYTGDAYCFKPMENVVDGSPLSTGGTVHIVGPKDEGLWWEGRSYFYTIPYTTTATPGYYPLQMKMQTNESGNNYTPTLYLKIKTDEPFVPWLRADFNLSKQLTAGSDTKTVE